MSTNWSVTASLNEDRPGQPDTMSVCRLLHSIYDSSMNATGLRVVEHTSRTGCVRLRYDRFKKLHGILGVLSISCLLPAERRKV
jgi:hypothetical protein